MNNIKQSLNNENVLSCHQLHKSFSDAGATVEVLKNINLQINTNSRIAIIGSSGSGKSTLLQLLGGLDKPDQGTIYWAQHNIHKISEKQRCTLRNKHLGFVYQFHHLLPEFTAVENIAMPLLIQGIKYKTAIDKAHHIIEKIKLGARALHKPSELSGGEKQRIAIARAVVTEPLCILADEPTGNLDNKTAEFVFDMLLQLNQEFNTSIVIVTHDLNLARKMQQVLVLENGQLQTLEQVA